MNCSVTHLHMRRALYRVFVQPALTDLAFQRSQPMLFCPRIASTPTSASTSTSTYQTRSKTTKRQKLARTSDEAEIAKLEAELEGKGKKGYKDRVAERAVSKGQSFTRPPPAIKGAPSRPPYDEEIPSMHIALVDRDGTFHPRVYKPDVLATLDRSLEHLVQVTAPSTSDDPYALPTCRIFLKSTLRARAKQLEDALRQKAKVAKSSKVVEISWVIAPADLEMKCKQVKTFLEEGRKVDVVLMPPERRRGWKSLVTQASMSDIVTRVQNEVEEIEGAAEVAKPDGKTGAILTMFFQGKK